MKDQVSITRVKQLHPSIREDVTKFITEAENALNITLRIVQGLRTIDEQNELYAQGRTKPGSVVTNAKGGSSYHNYGLAIDLGVLRAGVIDWNFDYKKLLPFSDKYGFYWGGNFKSIPDKPHFEKNFGINWKDLLKRYQDKKFIQFSKYVSLDKI